MNRARTAATWARPKPKVAAGVLTYLLLQLLELAGVDLGDDQELVEAVVTFAAMWLYRNPRREPAPAEPA